MRRIAFTLALCSCATVSLAGTPLSGEGRAFAQTSDAGAEGAEDSDSGAQAVTSAARFPIRRGFFAEGDFGVFFAFGGRNTNSPGLPTRSTSNLELTVGLTLGYDVVSTSGFNLGLGLRGAVLLNGGSGRVSDEDATGATGENPATRSNDFSIYETGLALNADFYLTDRLSISTKIDGGLAILNPDPSLAAQSSAGQPIAGAGGSGIGGAGSAALGINYATLLTGFQVGLDIRFVAVFFDGFIPALSATVPIKYNF